ncbi:aminoacyl-tRNA hydrolase [Gaopeijia maritima]|uniref:Peptidyl-tRNA hydrolase n=1 Tax=Gaopeijia maritima TaxID=3119007 RepID=A0ABU9EDX0_9BACT
MVVGLGNPGPRYDATRHNVGWWVLDRLAYDWDFGPFESSEDHMSTRGRVGERGVELRKPTRYMNRSGTALFDLLADDDFDPRRDLLVVVDDAALEVGRIRFRPKGGAGGHNGLRSIAEVLGTDEYARLRLGVGRCPDDVDLADWVLAPMAPDDEEHVVDLLPELTGAVELWLNEGTEAAMNRFNR